MTLRLGIKYSVRDVISGVDYFSWSVFLRYIGHIMQMI